MVKLNLEDIKEEVEEHVVPKIKWYLKYRTQIWSAVFFAVGMLGGSTATVQTYVPTLKYDTKMIESKLQQMDEISNKLVELKKSIDRLSNKN